MSFLQPLEEVIIFTRYPEPGKVKTRLATHLGPIEAARVHRRLTEETIKHVQPLQHMRPVRISMLFTGGSLEQMQQWLDKSIPMAEQKGEDLGQRMTAALRGAWARGAHHAVVIGSDCPSLDAELLALALDQLRTYDVVLGPTYDGGYYLIGLNSRLAGDRIDPLFKDIAWGTAGVFDQTTQRAKQKNLSVATLKTLHDIDRLEDLEYLSHHSHPQ